MQPLWIYNYMSLNFGLFDISHIKTVPRVSQSITLNCSWSGNKINGIIVVFETPIRCWTMWTMCELCECAPDVRSWYGWIMCHGFLLCSPVSFTLIDLGNDFELYFRNIIKKNIYVDCMAAFSQPVTQFRPKVFECDRFWWWSYINTYCPIQIVAAFFNNGFVRFDIVNWGDLQK